MAHYASGYTAADLVFSSAGEDFILAEDEALKALLKGIKVKDFPGKPKNRAVDVWYTLPDTQERTQVYPYMTVDLIDAIPASDRMVAGTVLYSTDQDGTSYSVNSLRRGAYPIPWDLHYQVTSYARHPYHDRGIISHMLKYQVPDKFGGLSVLEDSTTRRIELLGFVKNDTVEDKKKIYSNAFTLLVSTETELPVLDQSATPRVEEVDIEIEDKNTEYDYYAEFS